MKNYKEIVGLDAHEDAYGNNIADTFYGKGGGYDIIEREDGHFTLNGDSDAYTEKFELWSHIQKEASSHVVGKVLDIGCGGGKHSVHFQEQGLDITGMDNSPLALKICMERGLDNALLCDVLHLDEKVINELDTIFMWGNNFGLLQNAVIAKRFFRNCLKMCKKNAKILIETLDPYGKAFIMDDDRRYIDDNRLNGRLGGQIRVRVRYRQFVTAWKDYLFVSKVELTEILAGTGWVITETFDDTEIDQYIAVIERN
ncbi:MAG: class I SAM-dependent methyltransferase [Bacteroidetes bacterium]|nr:class I SAM-dependent methyltransferase [Bacteroidota bacterium]MBM3424594.1 class I SAM-dependent methyltransferase [Bacteroidota bacterium]